MSRSQEAREGMISGGFPGNHSMNQKEISRVLDGEKRLPGNFNKKVRRAKARRTKHAEFLRDLPRLQFERSLRNLIEDKGTDEDIAYVMGNISTYERHLSPDNGYNITLVDLN